FTSNGLMCLSGVTMCRICLSAIVRHICRVGVGWAKRAERSGDRVPTRGHGLPRFARSALAHPTDRAHLNLSAPIERHGHADVQPLGLRAPPNERCKARRLGLRWRKCEAGRAPRALADAERAFALENCERRPDLRTGKPVPALNRRIIIAQPRLH